MRLYERGVDDLWTSLEQLFGGLAIIARCGLVDHDIVACWFHQHHQIGRILDESVYQCFRLCQFGLRQCFFIDVKIHAANMCDLSLFIKNWKAADQLLPVKLKVRAFGEERLPG